MKRDDQIVRALTSWFRRKARPLPWRRTRRGRRDPYRSLVSEFMLQQTQVSRVLERFDSFLERFPTIDALADASESDVLAAWSGLGYYRRARLLHRAARVIRDEHASKIPSDPASLRALPGVGRYTAGAVSSIVFGKREPLVDGNVVRVLQRLDAVEGPPDESWSWGRAEVLIERAESPGVFNEALMELGATICTPGVPRCDVCPLARLCRASAHGVAEAIPAPRPRARRRLLYATSVVAIDRKGRVLLEERPPTGLWAKMWQCPTVERDDRQASPDELRPRLAVRHIEPVGRFEFLTTHRAVRFAVYRAWGARAGSGRKWIDRNELSELGLSSAHARVMACAGVEGFAAVSS